MAVLMTAAIFAVGHLQFRCLRLLELLYQGLIFGVLRGADRTLFASGTAHALLWAFMI
jgi:hypothetical protein